MFSLFDAVQSLYYGDYDGENYDNDDFENDGISDDYNFTVPALSVRLVFPYFMMISFLC